MPSLIDSVTDEQFKKIVADSTSYLECLQKLGYLAKSGTMYKVLQERIKTLNISTEHFCQKAPIERTRENVFVKNSTCDQKVLRNWFKKEPIPYECSICGQKPFWNGKEMIMILDHVNGVNNDDRLENLRWVCPNCNSQLPTTNGKNIKHKYKPKIQSKIHKHHCSYCDNLVKEENQVCRQCAIKINKQKMPTNLQLAKSIIEHGMTKTSEMYHVDRGTVRHWCKLLQIPEKQSLLKQWYETQTNK